MNQDLPRLPSIPEASEQVSRIIDRDETILWAGIPAQGILLRPADMFLIPFSLAWGGFALFWEATAFLSGAPVFFLLFGAIFVVVGIHIMIGRFFVDAAARSKTFYGITDRRVIVVSGVFAKAIDSMPIRTLTDISLRERANGRGSLFFGKPDMFHWWNSGLSIPGMSQNLTPSFESIPDARRVHDLILAAQRAST